MKPIRLCWLERQIIRQVPAEYFLLTFTIPAELRPLNWMHQGEFYELLLRCSWETVHAFSQNDKQLPRLQHVLPKGFRSVRDYGFSNPNPKRLITLLH